MKVAFSAQCAFKCKTLPRAGQTSEFLEDKTTGLPRGQFWPERRKPTGNEVGIYEMDDSLLAK